MKKRILFFLLALLVIIQFIRPGKNLSTTGSANDISTKFAVPENIHVILEKACYDCHSDNTYYPWYSNIQPIGWWLQYHVNEGKRELNFNEFAQYNSKKQDHKLKELIETVKESEMTLDSYTWLHKKAKLSEQEKQILVDWAQGIRNRIIL